MQFTGELVAWVAGTELPNRLSNAAFALLAKTPTQYVAVNNASSGFDTFDLRYDRTNGLSAAATYPRLSSGFGATLQAGVTNTYNTVGTVFDESTGALVGRLGRRNGVGPTNYSFVVVDTAESRVYAVAPLERAIDVFDESTNTRLARIPFDETQTGGSLSDLEFGVVTANSLVFATGSRVIRFDKPLVNSAVDIATACPVRDLSGVFIDGAYRMFGCAAFDAVLDGSRGLLYASMPEEAGPVGNAIAVIDASTLELVDRIALAANPAKLRFDPAADRLIVALAGTSLFAEIDVANRTVIRVTDIGFETFSNNTLFQPHNALGLAIRPGAPDEVVISTATGDDVLAFDAGTRRPNFPFVRDDYPNVFFNQTTTNQFVGIGSRTIGIFSVDANGTTEIGQIDGEAIGFNSVRQGNLVFGSDGFRLDLETVTVTEICMPNSVGFGTRAVTPNGSGSIVYFMETFVFRHRLLTCDVATGSIDEPQLVPVFDSFTFGLPTKLIDPNDGSLIYVNDDKLMRIAIQP